MGVAKLELGNEGKVYGCLIYLQPLFICNRRLCGLLGEAQPRWQGVAREEPGSQRRSQRLALRYLAV